MTTFAEVRTSEFGHLDQQGQVYLDHTGAGLPARRQLDAHAERIRAGCYGNPHSENPTSLASSLLVEETRAAILAHFDADPAEYAVVFTPNATGACRLVGEAFPFGSGCRRRRRTWTRSWPSWPRRTGTGRARTTGSRRASGADRAGPCRTAPDPTGRG